MATKTIAKMTPIERLTLALQLAIDAPVGREQAADKMVQAMAAGMSQEDIELVKQGVPKILKS